jgi:hypothetical protein
VVELTSPEGTKVRLHNRTGGSASDIITWYDSETQPDGPGALGDFSGEWAEGRWELYVADLASVDTGTLHTWALRFAFPPATSEVEDRPPYIVQAYFLEENRPNPFSDATVFRFGLPDDQRVRFDVFDVRGRIVATVADRSYPAGIHTIAWDGTDSAGEPVAGGIYFCRFKAGPYSATHRAVHVR